MIRVDFKRSLVEAIIPSNGTQPSACLQRYGALPCKVVITSTHALPRHPKGFPMAKLSKLSTLNGQLECTMSRVGASENPMKLKQKKKHTDHANIHDTQLRAIQVFNDRTPIDINVSITPRMLPNIDIARRQTILLTSSSVRATNTHNVSHLQQ